MEEMVTCKLETYINLVNKINDLECNSKFALNEADQAKEKLNNLVKTLIKENTNCDFDEATVEEIKSKDPSAYIYYCIYGSLKHFVTDDEFKEFLLEFKREQKDEKDS